MANKKIVQGRQKAKGPQKAVDIYYPKAEHHQTVHADGAWAALTTQLEIQVAFYKEIQPMPRRVRYLLTPEGALGEAVEKDGETGIVRETAATIVFGPDVAMQLMQLLQGMIEQARPRVEAQIKEAQKAMSEAAAQIEARDIAAK